MYLFSDKRLFLAVLYACSILHIYVYICKGPYLLYVVFKVALVLRQDGSMFDPQFFFLVEFACFSCVSFTPVSLRSHTFKKTYI